MAYSSVFSFNKNANPIMALLAIKQRGHSAFGKEKKKSEASSLKRKCDIHHCDRP
jgi:hypothetical protein